MATTAPKSRRRRHSTPTGLAEVLRETGCRMRIDMCGECQECVGRCPSAGLSGGDPRRLVTLALLGRDEEVVAHPWLWNCTLCSRCVMACPMRADVPALVRAARGRLPEDRRPEALARTCRMHLDTGNNTGIDQAGWLETLEWMEAELREEPGFGDFRVPVGVKGARVFLNQNSKEPQADPYGMWPLWKILHLAGESWTYPRENWEATNYCMFLGDEAGWETTIRRQVEEVHRLGCAVLANTE